MSRECVRWRGQSAVYTIGERQIMRQLPIKEQFNIHLLKSLLPGEVAEGTSTAPGPGLDGFAIGGSIPPAGIDRTAVYTDPEDIPFGKPASEAPKRVKKTYAVAWSWKKHKIHKTKKRCEQRIKVWKAWKERQGFKVMRFASGYLAEFDGQREVIQLHEYEAETKRRL